MSRKKTARRTAKRQSSNKQPSMIIKLEKEFMRTPAKLSATLNDDIVVLKQKESKLKNALNKHKSQVKNSENRIKAASSKTTVAGKKQLKKAKKAHKVLLKSHGTLNKQLESASKLLHAATHKQAKLLALKKHLLQFEKDWAKDAKKATSKVKVKAKSRKKSPLTETIKANKPTQELPQTQPYETSISDDIVTERTETIT